jgi:hypothetical protein
VSQLFTWAVHTTVGRWVLAAVLIALVVAVIATALGHPGAGLAFGAALGFVAFGYELAFARDTPPIDGED